MHKQSLCMYLSDLPWLGGRWVMGHVVHYFVRVTQRGRSNGRFGWEICRADNSLIVERSTNTFSTRVQALVASAKAASCLAFPVIVDSVRLGHAARQLDIA